MLDMRTITAATAVIGALALPATATADSDGSDGYLGVGAKAVDNRGLVSIPDAADGYRVVTPEAGNKRTSHPLTDAADSYRGVGAKGVDSRTPVSQLDARVTPVVRVIDTSGEEFHWDDAGIGAAGGLAVIAIAGGIGMVAMGRRRSARRVASAN
jgi:hypothetical protein